jgi:hypothetical protein
MNQTSPAIYVHSSSIGDCHEAGATVALPLHASQAEADPHMHRLVMNRLPLGDIRGSRNLATELFPRARQAARGERTVTSEGQYVIGWRSRIYGTIKWSGPISLQQLSLGA